MSEPMEDVLEIVRVQGLATIQDLGVRGFMHEALPPGGAMVPALLLASNRVVGNGGDACGVEVFGRATLRAVRAMMVSIDGSPAQAIAAGETIELASATRRCTYLAVAGGLRGIAFRGRLRGAFLAANIGAPLQAGATLALRRGPSMPRPRHGTGGPLNIERALEGDVVHIVPGPDFEAFPEETLATLTAQPYRILPASNRVGTRLAGSALKRRADYQQRSYPMTIGAIEVPADGQPIVFGPEHPVTGGHPLIGVVAADDLDRFHAIPLGGRVRFAVAP